MLSERIHAYLDGELPAEALTPDELSAADAFVASMEAATAHLRALPAPDFTARVMAALPAAAPAPRRKGALAGAWAWLWTPRPLRVTLRPAYGLAFAGVAALALAVPRGHGPAAFVRAPLPAALASAPATPEVFVQFRVEVPNAHSVALAGTFTGWKPEYELRETAPGEWSVLVPLHPGVHDYAFVVDGERWLADPNAPHVADSFGGTNSRISLPPVGAS